MTFPALDILRCPIDGLPLAQEDNSLKCADAHSFDIARRGYVNLLAASDKRSKDPGDSKDMIQARRDFLDAGHYLPIANKLAELALPLLPDDPVIVDAGCGEGYYLEQLTRQLRESEKKPSNILGFDISKWAVQAAARRLKAGWLVASNRNIPMADDSTDLLISLFGFPSYDTFRRVLKPTGVLLLAGSGPRHLIELREVIYPEVKSTPSRLVEEAQSAGFSLLDSSSLQMSTAALNRDEISQLLLMTPHLFRASREGRERAAALDKLSVTIDVQFDVLRPHLAK